MKHPELRGEPSRLRRVRIPGTVRALEPTVFRLSRDGGGEGEQEVREVRAASGHMDVEQT